MQNTQAYLKKHFPTLKEPKLILELAEQSEIMEFEEGKVLMDFGSYVKIIPLVLEGAVKVLRESDGSDGGELFLYYLYPGQSCAMTLNCCRVNSPSQIRAIAEENTKILAVPVQYVNDWMNNYSSWKEFTLNIYSSRFTELLHTLDSVAFHKMDERLLIYLEEQVKAKANAKLQITHQQIADDLHTSREVISRLLKKLENNKSIAQSRNRIEVFLEL